MILFDLSSIDLTALPESDRQHALLMYRSGLIRRDRSLKVQSAFIEEERRGIIEQIRAIERVAGVSRPYEPGGDE